MKISETLAEMGESQILIAQGQMELSRELGEWVGNKFAALINLITGKPAFAPARQTRN